MMPETKRARENRSYDGFFFDIPLMPLFSFNSFIKNLGNMKLIISGKLFDMQREKPESS